jgi:hypothetical protein
MKFSTVLILILIGISILLSCGCTGPEITLSSEEQIQVRIYADPIADNLLNGFNQHNYTQYSRDFSSELRNALDAVAFEQNRALIVSKIGLYIARSEASVIQSGDYLAANYKVDFEKEPGVDVRIVFKKGDNSHRIYGLWFNSPKLGS